MPSSPTRGRSRRESQQIPPQNNNNNNNHNHNHSVVVGEEAANNRNNNDAEDDDDEPAVLVKSVFEGAVQSVTGNKDYQFGDISKKTLSDLTGKDFLHHNNTDTNTTVHYEFGDITKNLLTKAGKTVLGGTVDDNYQFGDVAKNAIDEWKGKTLDPLTLYRTYMSQFTPNQQKILIVTLIRFLAIALLTWGFWSNLCTCVALAASWIKTVLIPVTTVVPTPLSSSGATTTTITIKGLLELLWSSTVTTTIKGRDSIYWWKTYTKWRIVLDPFFLIVQGAGTVFTVFPFERWLTRIEQNWVPKRVSQRYPLATHGMGLVAAFLLGNLAVIILMASLMIGMTLLLGTTLAGYP